MKNQKVLRTVMLGFLAFIIVIFIGQQVFAQNNVPNINGQWTYRANLFQFDGNGCGHSNQIEESTVTISQRGTAFISSGGNVYIVPSRSPTREYVKTAIGEGTIVNNQIQSRIQETDYRSTTSSNTTNRVLSWTGTISLDGNTISGNATCLTRGVYSGTPYSNQDSFSFTLAKRSPSNQNQPNNTPPATPPPSPNQTNRPPVTPPSSSTQTPSNAPAPPFPQEAGPNIIRPEFR